MKNKILVAALALLGVTIIMGAVFFACRSSETKVGVETELSVPSVAASVRQSSTGSIDSQAGADGKSKLAEKLQGTGKIPLGAVADGEDTDADGAAQAEADRVIEAVQEQLDSDDLAVVAAAARKLMGHANKFVRMKAVEALAWAEEAGYNDLKNMIHDQDPEVSREAIEAWALQTQTLENSKDKEDAVREVGEAALNMDAEAFQTVMDAMIDMDDARALPVLQGYANQTDDPEMLDLIYDAVNFRATPDEMVESKADIPRAIEEFNQNRAAEAAAEAAEAAENQ